MDHAEIIKRYSALSTCAISDALDSLGISGGLVGISARTPNAKCVGFAYTVKYTIMPDALPIVGSAGDYIDEVPPGAVVVIDNGGRVGCTTWGGILTRCAVNYRIAGSVVFGAIRDLETIQALHYPVFSSAVFLQSGKGRVQLVAKQCVLQINQVSIVPGDFLCADDNGCVVVPANCLGEVLVRAESVRETEAKILTAVQSEMALKQARKIFNYVSAWENRNI